MTPDGTGQTGPGASEGTDDEAGEGVVASTDPRLLESRWVLHSVTTPETGPVDADPQVPTELTFAAGAVSGRGGVNRFRGPYEARDDGTLTFGGIAATRMAGPEPAMTQENRFFAALSATVAFETIGDRLFLSRSDGETIAVLVRTVEERLPD